jgi:RHS repeat-associated protein
MAPVATTFQSSGLAVTHIYDANGNTTAMTDPLGNLIGLGYDDRNLLTVVQSGGATIANYQYDGLGIRVWRTITSPSAGTAATVYDPTGTGNLYGEYFAADYREYVYVNGIPVASATDAGRGAPGRTYLYADHLGTIRAATAPAGGTAYTWAWQNNAFGNQLKSGGDNFYNRFPGQYYDVETGLHYNVNRYYDPTTGRYVQSDPIGLEGGLGTYAYVSGSPLSLVDSLGLSSGTNCLLVGGAAVVVVVGACAVTGPGEVLCASAASVAALGALGCAAGAATGAMSGAPPSNVLPFPRRAPIPEKSCPADHDCEALLSTDTSTCNALTRRRGKRAGAVCHASASQRYAACLAGGTVPPLNTWNNQIMTHDHLLRFDEINRQIQIFRIFSDGTSVLYTTLALPAAEAAGWTDEIVQFAQRLGEDLLVDSPIARQLFNL